jgi:hypothetical protein
MSDAKLLITRKQLADFLKDPDAIKLFERLFSVVDGIKGASPLGANWSAALLAALGSGWPGALAATAFDGIIESGYDAANGYYDKYGNGTLHCWFTSAATLTTSLGGTAVYYANTPSLTFPMPFASNPAFNPFVSTTVNLTWAGGYFALSPTNVTYRILGNANNAAGYYGYDAWGKWQ